QSHKMEAVGQLAGGVAHDFNNLLTTILGCSDMILSEMGRDHEYKDMLEAIKKAGERATSLTRQLLAFSRKQILEPKILDLNHLIFDIHKMLHRMIGENIEYIAIPEKNLVRVKADPGQIEQIVLNLAVNARDAMPDGGKLILETKNVELDADFCRNQPDISPGRYAKLVVSDTGHGMDAETAERIFEPFFTTKDKGKGTGLGLSMVYGIMKQSGGHITVESEPGQGTTFELFFPQVKEEESELEEVDESPEIKLRGHETILLVEDDAMVRDFTETILAKHGYTVLSASYADEAFRIHQDHKDPIDLLLTDVVLPKVSGKEIAQTITAFRPGLKVLYMSGYTDEAIVHQGILEEGIRFLPKPFSGPTLLRAVRRYLDE
ncbi:response regulator, partial [bacterium]|nr:response regulator [bacterium]